MTPDGDCDHTALIGDEELHQHFNEVFRNADKAFIRKDKRSTYGKLLTNSYC